MSVKANSRLLRSLQKAEIYDHPVDKIELIVTHISWVLLTGDYAYKIKKPVNLGFLDFSTLEKREFYCNEELRLNRRLAPELYLNVVKITGSEQYPVLNGSGPVIEYAVQMRQFPSTQLLSELFKQGNHGQDYIDQIAGMMADFHLKNAIAEADSTNGSPDSVLQPILENFKQISQFCSQHFPRQLEQLKVWSLAEYKRQYEVFLSRKRHGFIRECHGDLHLGNIAVYKGQVMPFDGIEFNPDLYWIDVISDIAFLVMDLQDYEQPGLAFRFLNIYLEKTGDYDGLQVLRHYLVYRAIVRAKVNCIQLSQQNFPENQQKIFAKIDNYLQLAASYTLPKKPQLIICHGLSASGKSAVSQLLLENLHGIRVRSDVERKRLETDTSKKTSITKEVTDFYTKEMNRLTYQRLLQLAQLIIEAGYTVIVDATFLKQEQRELFYGYAKNKHLDCLIVHCHARVDIIRQRIRERSELGNDVSDADMSVLEQQIINQQKLTAEELKRSVAIDTTTSINIAPVLHQLGKGID